jgi:uncharacterized membrane protein YphA (DoxX/SURF4 family)
MAMQSTSRRSLVDWLAILVRWGMGGLFIYMGLSKAVQPVEFLKLVREYDMVTNPYLLNAIAIGLPWFEVFCGVLLIAGVAVRGTALMLVLMLIPFTALVLDRALQIADAKSLAFCSVKFDCGCGAGEVYICSKLIENALLTMSSLWLLTGKGQGLALWWGLGEGVYERPLP